jgi:hypothetical protein
MPFSAESFDLVLNRHGGFNPRELSRVLSPGGTFFIEAVKGG